MATPFEEGTAEPAPVYLNGTKYEMPLSLHERGVGIIPLGRVVVLHDGTKIAVLKQTVSKETREELFHGLDLDKIINEEPE